MLRHHKYKPLLLYMVIHYTSLKMCACVSVILTLAYSLPFFVLHILNTSPYPSSTYIFVRSNARLGNELSQWETSLCAYTERLACVRIYQMLRASGAKGLKSREEMIKHGKTAEIDGLQHTEWAQWQQNKQHESRKETAVEGGHVFTLRDHHKKK